VAREAGADTARVGTGAGAVVYGYWSGLAAEGYEWFYRPACSAGMIPTNGGEVCVFAGTPAGDRPGATYHELLAAATRGADGRLAEARPPRRLRTWVGRPGYVRQAHGNGWALVGDAGSFVDPLSTHGITDALRDAQPLARSLAEAGGAAGLGVADLGAALSRFASERDRVVGRLFDVVDRIAGYGWDLTQLPRHLLELSSAMSEEMELIAGTSDTRDAGHGGGRGPVTAVVR
jgi:flavin-dependent dehydrogenase